MPFPKLPANAAYIHLHNPTRRNALSLSVLRDLRSQLSRHLTSPLTGRLLTLPSFKSNVLPNLEKGDAEYKWLLDASTWRQERQGLPNVLVLRSEGPVFSSGHDLKELSRLSHDDVKETFRLCAEVMSLMRRSPAIVVCPVQGLATAAGFQLAMSTDYPIALADTEFWLPGASIGLPCTSPATAVSRRVSPAQTYRLLATAEPVTAADLGGAVDVVPVPEHAESTDTAAAAFGARVDVVIRKLAVETAGQPQGLGKWAYWTQLGIRGSTAEDDRNAEGSGGDGYEDAALWAGRIMALHARSEDANEGIAAFFEKREPKWST